MRSDEHTRWKTRSSSDGQRSILKRVIYFVKGGKKGDLLFGMTLIAKWDLRGIQSSGGVGGKFRWMKGGILKKQQRGGKWPS